MLTQYKPIQIIQKNEENCLGCENIDVMSKPGGTGSTLFLGGCLMPKHVGSYTNRQR